MTPDKHATEAEDLLDVLDDDVLAPLSFEARSELVARAQTHALLAIAGRLKPPRYDDGA